MDPETAVFWPLDPGWTLLSTLVIHVLLRARTRSLALLKTCPKYVAQTGFRNLPIGAHPHNGPNRGVRPCGDANRASTGADAPDPTHAGRPRRDDADRVQGEGGGPERGQLCPVLPGPAGEI